MKNLYNSLKRFIKSLLSGKDEVSSNRTTAIFMSIAMIGIMIFGLYSARVDPVKFKIVIDNLMYLVFGLFFLKSSDRIIDIFSKSGKKDRDSNESNNSNIG